MACLPLVAEDSSLDDAELWDFIDSTIARRIPHSNPLLLAHKPPVVTELPPSPQTFSDTSASKRFPRRQSLSKPQAPGSFKDQSPPVRSCNVPAYKVESEESPCAMKQSSWIQSHKVPRREEDSPVSQLRFDRAIEPRGIMQRSTTSARPPFNQIVPRDMNVSASNEFFEGPRSSRTWPDSDENRLQTANKPPVNDWMLSVPSATMFKHIQHAALSVLEKGDYVMMQGKPFIKKCGWRKIAFFFNISFEIKDRTIQYDQSNNVQRAEFIVRANMQSGRFSDGWGSCDRGEKRFSKPNHDVPSTAETRAKTRACQDLLGIGEYKGI